METVVKIIVENVLVPAAAALVKERLEALASGLQIAPRTESNDGLAFPSAALIGLGQCGTNICLNVAELLRAVDDDPSTVKHAGMSSGLVQRVRDMFERRAVRHLFAPVILLADLNVDNKDTLMGDGSPVVPVDGYRRCHFIDLGWLQTGGAGNIPFKGQFLGRLALASDLQIASGASADRSSWLNSRAYFVDTLGLRDNPSRLLFCTFSTGGGTGSGVSLEIGAAQQAIYKERLERSTAPTPELPAGARNPELAEHVEPICALGIGIMPRAAQDSLAQSINTGRCICAYLSRERAFNLGEAQRIFNALILVSNEVMTWEGDDADKVENRQVMGRANEYVAQQMFHLLAAQALSKDYEQRRRGLVGFDEKETIRLDASDLANALRGPTVVTYAESIPNELDLNDLFRRGVGFPRYNAHTECLEGISLIPHPKPAYSAILENTGEKLAAALGELPVFRQATTVVVILSVPERYQISERDSRLLKQQVSLMSPKATIRRYTLVQGASRHIGLCMVFGESACLSPEVRGHLNDFLINCFKLDGVSVEDFGALLTSVVKATDSSKLDDALAAMAAVMKEREDPSAIICGGDALGTLKLLELQLAARAAQLGLLELSSREVLLSRQEALNALAYINRCYRNPGPPHIEPSPLE